MSMLTRISSFIITNKQGLTLEIDGNEAKHLHTDLGNELFPKEETVQNKTSFEKKVDELVDICWSNTKCHSHFIDAIGIVRQLPKLTCVNPAEHVALREAKYFVEHMMACTGVRSFNTPLPEGEFFYNLKLLLNARSSYLLARLQFFP